MRYALCLLLLLLPIGAAAQTGVVSGATVTATGSSASRTLANRFAQVFNVKDYGAKGDCSTDDSVSIAAAENAAMAVSKGSIPTVYFPAACYVLGAGATLPLLTHPVHLRGDGTHKTYLSVSTSYVGDIFSFSEIWQGASYTNGMLPTADNAGIMVTGISVFGNKGSSHVNNALAFYDRDNFAVVRDFEAFYLNGACLFTGVTKSQTVAYVRESLFYNIRCNNTGTTLQAAVDISSTTGSGGDATNELQFYGLNIFGSAGVGLDVRNPNNFSATRDITFFGPRVEFSASDDIQIGSSTDAGQVSNVKLYSVEAISPGQTNDGKYGINIDTAGLQLYDIMIFGGSIGPCWSPANCNGVNIGNVRLSRVQVENIAVAGTAITYQTTVGNNVILDGNGAEQTWSYGLASGTPPFVKTGVYKYGNPSAGTLGSNAPSVTSSYHDGSGTFGNATGVGAVDLQNQRNSATQVASGNASCLIAGGFNTVSGINSCIVGGSTNTSTGNQSFIGGGQNATDRGRLGVQVFSPGQISTAGDAQTTTFVLSATCSSCSSARLASSHGSPNTADIANISNSQSYSLSWRCVARDTTTAGTDIATLMPIALLTRDANVGSTALVNGTSTSVSRGTWTGGGFAFSADTTNGGVNIAFTSPTGNTDTFHAVCEGHDAETQ